MMKIARKARAALLGRGSLALFGGFILGGAFFIGSWYGVHYTSTPAFCMTCHEMRVVGEQGWMKSPHYRNDKGVVAACADCHVPPGLFHMVWVKSRDGAHDIVVHALGESDPHLMDWSHLEERARGKIGDPECVRCHSNITGRGVPLKAIMAHREYGRTGGRYRCVDCHQEEFHGEFKRYLFESGTDLAKGGEER